MKLFTHLRIIFRRVRRKLFPSTKDLLTDKYIDIMLHLRGASNLNDLMASQKLIKEFKILVLDFDRPYWAKPMMRTMDNLWNLKYKLWKRG